jgi:hypothetical protein
MDQYGKKFKFSYNFNESLSLVKAYKKLLWVHPIA